MSEDVKVTIGADATPFKQAMSQVQETAKSTGAQIGLSFGNKSDFREDLRVERSLDRFLRTASAAQDPIQALAAGVESLGSFFRIAGGAMLAFAVGDFFREQLTKAAEATEEFYSNTEKIFEVTKNSTQEFAEDAIKSFKDAEDKYSKEGFLQRLIYGSGQRQTLKLGKKAVEDALDNLNVLRETQYKADAESLSSNLGEQKQGAIDHVNQEYDEKVKKAISYGDDVEQIELGRHRRLAQIEDEYQKKYADSRQQELNKQEEILKPQEEADKAHNKELERQTELRDEQNLIGKSGHEKIDALKEEIHQHQIAYYMAEKQSDKDNEATKILELQNKLLGEQNDLSAKRKELKIENLENLKEQTKARQDILRAQANAAVGSPEVSSLRKIGLSGDVGAQKDNGAVRELKEANQRLDKLILQSEVLNGKIGAT